MAVAGLTPTVIERFGGLNFTADPEEIGFAGALDVSNVQLQKNGMLRVRSGYDLFATTPVGSNAFSLMGMLTPGGVRQLLVGSGANVYVYDNALLLGTATFTTGSGGSFGFTRLGTPSAGYAFAGNGWDPVQRWDGSVWAAPTVTVTGGTGTSMPKAGLLAVTPWDNRLVATGFGPGVTTGGPGGRAGGSSRSTVWFSNPGDPLTWQGPGPPTSGGVPGPGDTGSYVILSPGDGEWITSIAVWNNQLFVFKQTKFFVFYGVSSDATGQPVFNYRTVSGNGAMPGIGVNANIDPQGVAVGRDGVYFRDINGIYRTGGSAATEISAPIRPFFNIGLGGAPYMTDSTLRWFTSNQAMCWHRDRLYIAFQGNGANGLLVFDPQLDAWMIWTIPVQCLTEWTTGTTSPLGLYFTISTPQANNFVYDFHDNYSNDYPLGQAYASAAIPWYYQSGFSDLGQPAREKTIRETEVVANNLEGGTINLEWIRDLQASTGGQAVSSLSPVTATSRRGLQRYAQAGELLSFRLSGTAGAEINRVVPMLRETRGAGERTS